MRAAWAWLAVTLAVSLLAAAPLEPVEAAAPADAVAERYEAGKAALAAGRFEDALAAFEAAEGLATDEVTRWQVLLGLALTHELAGRPIEAIARYQAFLARSEGSPRAATGKWRERRAEARTSIAALEGEVLQTRGALTIQAGPDVAEVSVTGPDGSARVVPPAVLYLPPGPWSVTAAPAGKIPFERAGTLRAGDRVSVTVAFALPPADPERAPSVVMLPGPPTEADAPVLPYIAVGAGVAMVVVGAVFTGLAVSDRDEVERLSGQPGTPEVLSAHARLTERGQERETISWVLYGVGATAIVAGAVSLALDDGDEAPRSRVDVGIAPGGATIGYTTGF